MAKKEERKNLTIEPIKQTIIDAELNGLSDLILCKKSRSYERSEVWKQTNPKGSKMPKIFDQEYNLWEHLITSITWDKPITFHDDDYSLYSVEEWRDYMTNNSPCILASAFTGAAIEAFITFGFKDSTGKAGTDFRRSVNFQAPKFPISFASVDFEQKLVPNNGISKTNVVAQYNVFHGWKCRVILATADIVFPYETILGVLAAAGKFIGIGTQRKNGFGRFELGTVNIHNGLNP